MKAALYPILFELLPEKFTIPQIVALYEGVYDTELDTRNFSRKLLSLELIIKLKEKDKENSKKGAFYFRLNKDSICITDFLSLDYAFCTTSHNFLMKFYRLCSKLTHDRLPFHQNSKFYSCWHRVR